jgi:uncharacterized protein YndB with AHSA1/START domain
MTDTGVVEQTLRIRARPETVWRYWTDPRRMGEWLGVPSELEPRPGGGYRVAVGDGPVMRGEFLELAPPTRLVLSFGWEPTEGAPPIGPGSTRVEVLLAEEDGDTVLTLRHTGLPVDLTEVHHAGWARFLPILADTAERSESR